jgi:hypothetical protein
MDFVALAITSAWALPFAIPECEQGDRRARRRLLQAHPGGLDRRYPALVIGFHQRGQLCRRQFRSVQAKFIEPALNSHCQSADGRLLPCRSDLKKSQPLFLIKQQRAIERCQGVRHHASLMQHTRLIARISSTRPYRELRQPIQLDLSLWD